MPPHQQRVVDEKLELDIRTLALQKFILTPEFEKLDLAERSRLTTQSHLMVQLSAVLGQRIAAF